jgi:predicted aspartyl protease
MVLAQTEYGKMWMLVDTGCWCTLFSPETAKRTRMKVSPVPIDLVDGDGNIHKSDGAAPIQRLSIGDADFFGFYAMVGNTGNAHDKDLPIGGVAGRPLFGDREVPVMIDTGFSGTIMIPQDQRQYFRGANVRLAKSMIRAFYGDRSTDLTILSDDLKIGHHTIKDPIVIVTGKGEPMLGSQYLKQFIVTIDQRNRRIRFMRPGGQPLTVPSFRQTIEHELALENIPLPTTNRAGDPATQPAASVDERE